jgi:tetratricopeptide (TPR) repeat protein/DNA-binding SARP family transcriptional activator
VSGSGAEFPLRGQPAATVSDDAVRVVGLQLRALGPVEAVVGGESADLGPPMQRALFGCLLSRVDQPVAVDTLIEELWSGEPPAAAMASLLTYVSNLRRVLEPHRSPRAPAVVLRTRAPGYLLDSRRAEVDFHRFSGHATTGHEALARGDSRQAVREFDAALGLWRGPPYADMRDARWATPEIARLEELRLSVIEGRFTALLKLGAHPMAVAELEAHVRTHPLREHGCELLARALYQGGRQAEALAVLRATRVKLVEELGIDPGTALQRLERDILTQASTLDWHPPKPTPTVPTTEPAMPSAPASANTAGPQLAGDEASVGREAPTATLAASLSAPRPVPRQLPAHTPHFVGRVAELRQLTTHLNATTAGGGTVVITAIEGTAGIGKTALALHWAHQAAERFADGQLYVNLRGFDPTNTPVEPAAALRGFLDAFGITPERIPTSVDAQAGLYRSLLTDRRVLMVLDNARDAEQVRPLLPASPTCLVVITSRNQLAGLIAQQGARPVTLDVLSSQEARALLARHLGPDRVSAESRAITDLIKHCARLPLALAIVAARAATHPGFELRVLAKELAEEHTRLDALDTGDPTASVRAVFSWSYQHLSPPTARMFRLLGLHPGPDIALPSAGHLTGMSLDQAREALGELARAHLLTQRAPGRFAFHDLLRAYATHLTTIHDSPEDHHAALTRLFDYYLHTAAVAMDTVQPAGQPHQLHLPSPAGPTPPGADPTTAQHWLDTEGANLAAIIAYTAAYGWHAHATRLANTVLLRYLETGVRYPDALALYTHVQRAAHHTNDHTTEALALTHLGLVYWEQGRYQQATDHYQQALAISRDIGDRIGEAFALTGVGVVYWQQGRYQQATDHHQQALAISRENGSQVGEILALAHLGLVHWQQGRYQQTTDHLQQAVAISRDIGYRAVEAFALAGLGFVHGRQGRYQQASDHLRQALEISRDIGYRVGEVFALTGLGFVHSTQGDYQQITDHYHQALAVSRDTGYRAGEARALTHLGFVHGQQGRYQQATEHHQRALAICRDIGDRADEAQILNGLGEAYHANGHLDQARTQHTAALTLATEIGDRYEQAHAYHGLAHTHHTTGDLDQAHHHWRQALTLYTDLGVPHPDDLHTGLLRYLMGDQTRPQSALDQTASVSSAKAVDSWRLGSASRPSS